MDFRSGTTSGRGRTLVPRWNTLSLSAAFQVSEQPRSVVDCFRSDDHRAWNRSGAVLSSRSYAFPVRLRSHALETTESAQRLGYMGGSDALLYRLATSAVPCRGSSSDRAVGLYGKAVTHLLTPLLERSPAQSRQNVNLDWVFITHGISEPSAIPLGLVAP